MLVIPAINCEDFECVEARLRQSATLGASWAHFDVSDGVFAPARTWEEPELISNFKFQISNLEVHLMVAKPEEHAARWLAAGAKRVIVHVESIYRTALEALLESLPEGVELGLAVSPETPLDAVEPFLDMVSFVQCLAVAPGLSGQVFHDGIIERVRELKAYAPDITVEVDGGITPETARRVRETGADIVVSASYIFGHADPREAYRRLVAATS